MNATNQITAIVVEAIPSWPTEICRLMSSYAVPTVVWKPADSKGVRFDGDDVIASASVGSICLPLTADLDVGLPIEWRFEIIEGAGMQFGWIFCFGLATEANLSAERIAGWMAYDLSDSSFIGIVTRGDRSTDYFWPARPYDNNEPSVAPRYLVPSTVRSVRFSFCRTTADNATMTLTSPQWSKPIKWTVPSSNRIPMVLLYAMNAEIRSTPDARIRLYKK